MSGADSVSSKGKEEFLLKKAAWFYGLAEGEVVSLLEALEEAASKAERLAGVLAEKACAKASGYASAAAVLLRAAKTCLKEG